MRPTSGGTRSPKGSQPFLSRKREGEGEKVWRNQRRGSGTPTDQVRFYGSGGGKQKTQVRDRGESKNRRGKKKKEKRKSSQMEITKRNKTGQEEAGRERRERGEAGLAEGMSRGPPLGSPPSAGCRGARVGGSGM